MTAGPSLRCDACGYDLRGTDPKGRCPECGLAVAASIRVAASRPPPLRDADPRRLRWVVLGAWLLVLLPVLLAVISLNNYFPFGLPQAGPFTYDFAFLLMYLAGALVMVPVAGSSRRRKAFALAGLYLAATCVYWMSIAVTHFLGWPWWHSDVWTLATREGPLCVLGVTFFLRLASLAGRLPAFGLRLACRLVAGIVVLSFVERARVAWLYGNIRLGDAGAPFGFDLSTVVSNAVYFVRVLRFAQSPASDLWNWVSISQRYGWIAATLPTPAAFAVVTWFAASVTRAWRAARRRAA